MIPRNARAALRDRRRDIQPLAADAQKVGQAELIRNEVVNVDGAQLVLINVGDDVMRDAVIRTSADANARFGLIDNTKLTLGPGAELKIDRAVLAEPVALQADHHSPD